MPAISIDDEAAGFMRAGLIELSEDFGECGGFCVAAPGIQPLQLFRNVGGALRVFGGEQLNNFGGDVHAPGGVDAGGEAKAYVDWRKVALRGIELCDLEKGAQAGMDGP